MVKLKRVQQWKTYTVVYFRMGPSKMKLRLSFETLKTPVKLILDFTQCDYLFNYIEGKIYSNMNRFGSTLRTALYNEQAVNKLISLKTVNKRYTNYI